MPDVHVAASPAAGDARALHQVYDSYADRVYDYALSLTGDERVAAEATHDVFSALRDEAAEQAPQRAVLYAHVRRAARARPAGSLPRQRTPAPAHSALGRRVDDISALLPPDQAELIELVYRHGLRPDELGTVLGVSQHRVLGLLVVARERLERGLGAGLPPGRLPDLGLARVPEGVAVRLFASDTDPAAADVHAGRHRDRSGAGRRPGIVGVVGILAALALAVGLALWLVPDRVVGGDGLAPTSSGAAGTAEGAAGAPPRDGAEDPAVPQSAPAESPGEGPERTERTERAGDQPTPGRASSPSDTTPTEPVPAAAPELRVSTRQITLERTGPRSTARIRLTAVGGDVAWVAILMGTTADLLALDADAGRLAEGESTVVTLSARAGVRLLGAPLTVLFQPGSALVEVSVQGSRLR